MAKFNDFVGKINKSKSTDKDTKALSTAQQWMAKPLKFHVDSEKAYNVQKAKEYEQTLGTGKNFEQFVTKGDATKTMKFMQFKQ